MKLTRLVVVATLAGSLAVMPGALRAADETNWTDRVSISGDLRLRAEGIYDESREDRERGRFRIRLGIDAQIADDLELSLRLASGGGNPVSTNTTFGEGLTQKDFGIDRAFITWAANDVVNVLAGKMKNPWFRAGGNSLLWDGDLNPEGAAVTFSSGSFFGNAGIFAIDEDGSSGDTTLYAAQAGVALAAGESSTLKFGIGAFEFADARGQVPFFREQAKGNSLAADGTYRFDYSILEGFVELETERNGKSTVVFADYAQNTEVDEEDTAFAFGAKFRQGDWQVSYAYHSTEADALIGTFTDSDLAGGSTDSNGHLIRVRYDVRDHVELGGTFILSQLGEFAGNERDYERVMIDLAFDF